MKKHTLLIVLCFILAQLILSACERERAGCESGGDERASQPKLQLADLIQQTPEQPQTSEVIEVEIRGKMRQVDKLVDYPLCNDDWSGTVYVSCDAQVAESELDAQANPLFLKGCNLNIAPNTVVYVAAHNDEAFYKGCSCHTGGSPLP